MQSRKTKNQPSSGRKLAKSTITGAGNLTCVLKTSRLNSVGSTDSSGWSLGQIYADPFNSGFTTPAANGLTGSYEFWRLKSLSVEIIPAGGTLVSGNIMCAYINNPEIIANWNDYSDNEKGIIITNEQGSSMFSAALGGVKVYNKSRHTSRNWYQTNFTVATSPAEIDRTIPTMFAWLFRDDPSVTVKVKLSINATFELSGLSSSAPFTLLSSSGLPRLRYIPMDGEEEMPPAVLLSNRSVVQEYRIYSPPAPVPTDSL